MVSSPRLREKGSPKGPEKAPGEEGSESEPQTDAPASEETVPGTGAGIDGGAGPVRSAFDGRASAESGVVQ